MSPRDGRWRRRVRALLDLAAAQRALLVVAAKARRRAPGELVDIAGENSVPATIPASDLRRAKQLALAIERAARWGPIQPSCLVRALALQVLLRLNGVSEDRVRVGVRWDSGGFAAHAWVELGPHVLDDTPLHVATFTRVTDVRSMRR